MGLKQLYCGSKGRIATFLTLFLAWDAGYEFAFSKNVQEAEQPIEANKSSLKRVSNQIASEIQTQTGSQDVKLRFDANSLSKLDKTQIQDLTLEQVVVDQSRHCFKATITVLGIVQPLVLKGGFTLFMNLPFVVRAIHPGELIEEADLEWRTVEMKRNLKKAVLRPSELIQHTPKQRPLEPGQVINVHDVQKPIWIRKQEMVKVHYKKNGLHMTQLGKALEDGGQGDVVRILNLTSRKTISATVTAVKEVTVAADS